MSTGDVEPSIIGVEGQRALCRPYHQEVVRNSLGRAVLKVVRYGEPLKRGIHVNFSKPGGATESPFFAGSCDGSPKIWVALLV